MNLRATVHVRGHLSLFSATVLLILNLALPGLGTALLACFINEQRYLSPTAIAQAQQAGLVNELQR